ncbi:MAG: DUF3575 domain-containing protein [Rikenellaceae bacterium]|nr:DUF3575 domain-containing protein [Rikenellaceae bacterium]
MSVNLRKLIPVALLFLLPVIANGQKIGVKSNLLYDATATVNLGFEAALGHKTTLDISGNYNGWSFGDARWRHWLIQPEFRYWLCERFEGHFLGLHGHYAQYNVGGINLNDNMNNNRYQGYLYGAGLSYGYQWVVGKRWNLEATVGAGYARMFDRKIPLAECGEMVRKKHYNYWGPTKIGLSFIYIIK